VWHLCAAAPVCGAGRARACDLQPGAPERKEASKQPEPRGPRAQALANDSAFVRVAKGVYALRAIAGSVTPAYKSPGRSRRDSLRPPRAPRVPVTTLLLEAFEDDFDGEEEEEARR